MPTVAEFKLLSYPGWVRITKDKIIQGQYADIVHLCGRVGCSIYPSNLRYSLDGLSALLVESESRFRISEVKKPPSSL
jgi:hypothetical protein